MDELFHQLDDTNREVAFERAASALIDAEQVDALFDLRMLKAKLDRGIPGDQPATLSDVPAELRSELEGIYRDAAREAGQSLLDRGDIAAAWSYFSAIREPKPVRDALEAVVLDADFDERQQELAEIALFQAANPKRGVQMWLAGPGICNTVTALDSLFPQLSSDDRADCAAVLVEELHGQLLTTLQRDATERSPLKRPSDTIAGILSDSPGLLDNAAYHTDVSHLSAVVRFARSLPEDSPMLPLAIDLCEYGRRLDPSLQYGSEPPFESLYEASQHYFGAIRGTSVERRKEGLDYFRSRLENEPDEPDQPPLAYVLTDLLMRTGEVDEAVDVARKYLAPNAAQTGFSFAELCRRAGRLDALAEYGRSENDVVSYLNGRFADAGESS